MGVSTCPNAETVINKQRQIATLNFIQSILPGERDKGQGGEGQGETKIHFARTIWQRVRRTALRSAVQRGPSDAPLNIARENSGNDQRNRRDYRAIGSIRRPDQRAADQGNYQRICAGRNITVRQVIKAQARLTCPGGQNLNSRAACRTAIGGP